MMKERRGSPREVQRGQEEKTDVFEKIFKPTHNLRDPVLSVGIRPVDAG
jgi:hypothetical protein